MQTKTIFQNSKEKTHRLYWIDTENPSKEIHKSFACDKKAAEFSMKHLTQLQKEGKVKSLRIEGL